MCGLVVRNPDRRDSLTIEQQKKVQPNCTSKETDAANDACPLSNKDSLALLTRPFEGHPRLVSCHQLSFRACGPRIFMKVVLAKPNRRLIGMLLSSLHSVSRPDFRPCCNSDSFWAHNLSLLRIPKSSLGFLIECCKLRIRCSNVPEDYSPSTGETGSTPSFSRKREPA
jgi:hypothetical protein